MCDFFRGGRGGASSSRYRRAPCHRGGTRRVVPRGVSQVSGGFVGVDIFFVISGYLITSLILGEMADGRFSLLSFYERRIRRIFPALFDVLAVLPRVGFDRLFMPPDLVAFGRSLVATALFVSNMLFLWGHRLFRCAL